MGAGQRPRQLVEGDTDMIDLDDLNTFMDQCCVKTGSNLTFNAFVEALRRWMTPARRHEVTRDDVFYLMQGQDRFDLDVRRGKVTVLGCAIPDVQREMVES